MNRLDVYRKRPRQWASSIPVIPMQWVDVNEGGAKQLEYRSRLYGKEFERWNPTVECAMFGPSSRKIMFLDAARACCLAGATNEVSIEPQRDEHVVCQDLIGEMSTSLSGLRNEAHDLGEKAATSVR